jgi:uncharacterized protein YjbI with pentapeptide repeats
MPALGVALGRKRLSQAELEQICQRHERLWRALPGGARAVFSYLDMSGVSLRGRNLTDADFTGANLADADLRGAKLDNANLFGVDLQNARLNGASLRRSDLRGSCLRGADLSGADLFEADLREGCIATPDAKLGLRTLEPSRGASLAGGVSLAGANLTRSRLSGVMA